MVTVEICYNSTLGVFDYAKGNKSKIKTVLFQKTYG